jgi:hypothetical protein
MEMNILITDSRQPERSASAGIRPVNKWKFCLFQSIG